MSATISPVGRGRTWMAGRTCALIATGGCVVVMGGLTWLLWPGASKTRDLTAAPVSTWNMGRTLPDSVVPKPTNDPTPKQTLHSDPPVAPPVQTMGFWEDTNAVREAARQLAPRDKTAPPDPDVATPAPLSDYAQRMRTTDFADAAPMPHLFHRHYTIKKGTVFPCTPAQPISSSLPGPVRCTTDQDVWSMDSTTILLPRGTQVNGTVERGLGTGEERLFLVWTDALTPRPDLLPIPLDSPAADELGQTGVPGDVDDHLWRRMKAALLLSAVQFVTDGGTAALEQGRNNTSLNFNGVSNTGNSLAAMALAHDLNIPATLYRGPGYPLTVYVNHYVDLFHFYQDKVR